jgi:thiol-disulfide isomerase/thioredoxin
VLASAILFFITPVTWVRQPLLPMPRPDQNRGVEGSISGSLALGWTLAGILGGGILISGQALVEKRRFVVVAANRTVTPASDALNDRNQDGAVSTNSAYVASMAARYQPKLAVSGATQSMGPLVRRIGPLSVDVHGGIFSFRLDELPVIGSPEAPHVVLSLFDYSCHHCRDLHPRLIEIQKRYSNEIAFLLLPTPLNSNCNPVVKVSLPDHSNSCEYARLALGIWRAKPAVFRQYDDWLFGPAKPVTVAEAKQYATQLVGRDALERALADEWIAGVIRTNGFLYKTNYQVFRKSTLPELMMGSVTTFGSIPRESDLLDLLSKHLGLNTSSGDRSKPPMDSEDHRP